MHETPRPRRRPLRAGAHQHGLAIARARAAARRRREAALDEVAHELRTPLTSLMLGSGLLLEGRVRGRRRHDVLVDVVAEVQRLADTVEDLLVLSGPPAPVPDPQPLSLPALVRAEIDAAAVTAPGIRYRLHVRGAGHVVTTDERVVRHLVHNLVAAGSAAACERGMVEVTVRVDDGVHGSIRVVAHRPRPGDGRAPPCPPAGGALRDAATRMLAERIGARVGQAGTSEGDLLELALDGEADVVDASADARSATSL